MDLEVVAIIGVILGLAAMVVGMGMAFDYRRSGAWIFGLPLGAILLVSSIVVGVNESEKKDCLRNLPVIAQAETKWLGGECYVKANDGKFVPRRWIEKGYDD